MSSRRRPSASVRLVMVAAAMLLGVVAGVAPASAHARLVSISPAAGARLSTPPTEVVLTFDEPPAPDFSVVEVTGPGGASVTKGAPAADGARVRQALAPNLASGPYTVAWKAVSDDGHPVSGTSGFVYGAASASSTTSSATSNSATSGSATSGSATSTGGVRVPAPSANGSTTPVAGAADTSAGTPASRGGALWIIGLAAVMFGSLAWIRALRRRHPTHGADD